MRQSLPQMTTVHMIANAHLDPVWLWPWQRGADEALATCRSACDILDDYPDVIFTRGEAWVYEQVRTLDPDLFGRIRLHIEGGRWCVVNGWWVQPDVNLPIEESLAATARLGLGWFQEHLGIKRVPVAYNVDSFGHGAFLPRIIRQAGQDFYVMMRPSPGEKKLPSSLFRWRSPDGHEVLTFRINSAYNYHSTEYDRLRRHIDDALAARRPEGIDHVMCFYGVGNHGGGPTRKLVDWIQAHRDWAPGVRLEFSSPERFFAAVCAQAQRCPVVEGELQHHAIGCYSVCGRLKRDIRAAELMTADAQRLIERYPAAEPDDARRTLDTAWRAICFNQFHDILAGTATAEAIEMARREIGGARTAVDRLIHTSLRRDSRTWQRPVTGHRVHVANLAPTPWSGLADVEIAMDIVGALHHHLADAQGRVVPHQQIAPSSLVLETFATPMPRILFPVNLQPGEIGTWVLRDQGAEPPPAGLAGQDPCLENGRLRNEAVEVHFGPAGIEQIMADAAPQLAGPLALIVIDDQSDTWSHGVQSYTGPVLARGRFGAPVILESGPLRTLVRLDGTLGEADARLFVSLDRDSREVQLSLDINYSQPFTVLKAGVCPNRRPTMRLDRVCGGWINRQIDGLEYPVHHAILAGDESGFLGLLFPDSFAADVSADGAVRITLLRNNVHAYHSYSRLHETLPQLRGRFGTDDGPQSLRLSLLFGTNQTQAESALVRLQHPPIIWDDYKGVSRVARFE